MRPDAGGAHGPATSSPDEAWLEEWVARSWRAWRAWHGAHAVTMGIAVSLLAHAALVPFTPMALVAAGVAGVAAAGLALATARGLRDARAVIEAAEAQDETLRNALFTWHESRGRLAAPIANRLASSARATLGGARSPRPASARAWRILLALLVTGLFANAVVQPRSAPVATVTAARGGDHAQEEATQALRWSVVVTPPAYTRRPEERLTQPSRIDVLAGARVAITFMGWRAGATLRLGDTALAMADDVDGVTATVSATSSEILIARGQAGEVLATLTLVVRPDSAPTVRITAPAADVRRAEAAGTVAIAFTAQDDLGLRDLRLRFTKISGSGENFTFEDGEWPVDIRKTSPTEWGGAHLVSLPTSGLSPGDSVVYYAVAHDARPGADGAAESERYLIEITKPGAIAAGDFSLPEPEDRFALSQRMVILLTERLLERRPRMSVEEFAREAESLALAQRRVRAEFVFMLGGEVEDEVEEASHSHEVESGREDNRGRGDLTAAVRQMSQAETKLTAAAVREALPYEYRALAALQAAFGRARYFMRTLPAPVQLDASRRLQGERDEAASSRWVSAPLPPAGREPALDLIGRLEAPGASIVALAPALVALDRGDAEWVGLVQRAAAAGDLAAVSQALRARVLAASPDWMSMPLPRTREEANLAAPEGRP